MRHLGPPQRRYPPRRPSRPDCCWVDSDIAGCHLLQDRCNKAATRKEEPWNENQGRRPVVRGSDRSAAAVALFRAEPGAHATGVDALPRAADHRGRACCLRFGSSTSARAGAPRSTTCNTPPEHHRTGRFHFRSPLSPFPSASRSFRPCMPVAPSLTRSTAHGVCRSPRRREADAVIPARSGEW
jgi:hypothetical protein